ncbi:MAG: hypothetical protein ACQGVK_23275 [Myxococcota bacterium]
MSAPVATTESAHSQPAAFPTPSPWLYGPGRDVFFGYGLACLLSVPLYAWYFLVEGHSDAPIWLGLLMAILIIKPHFGATILRAYERREDRRRYAIFTVWVTLAFFPLFIGSLHSAWLGSILVTLYVSWTPWHFSGQNYGVGVMYLRRRGIPIDGSVKRAFYATFVLSAILAVLSIHMVTSSLVYSGGVTNASSIGVIQLGVPLESGAVLGGLLGIGWLGCLGFVARHLLGRAPAAALLPIGLLVLLQSLWFVVPALALTTRIFSLPPEYSLPFFAVWTSAFHSTQYLWITSYYARRSNPDRGGAVYLGRAVLVGAALVSPAVLFAPGLLGEFVPNGAHVPLLVLALMNLHHFVLDGAIWKLRDGRVARVLLRSEGSASAQGSRGLAWAGGLALGLAGSVALLVQLYSLLLTTVVSRPGVEVAALHDATVQLAWLGKASPSHWARLARRWEVAGEPNRAVAAYARYFEKNREPDPGHAERALRLILAEKNGQPAMLRRAEGLARYLASRQAGRSSDGEELVAAVAAARGHGSAAVDAAERALEIARSRDDATAVARIQRKLSSYRRAAGTPAVGAGPRASSALTAAGTAVRSGRPRP